MELVWQGQIITPQTFSAQAAGLRPRPQWGAYSAPQIPLAGIGGVRT